MVIKPSLPPLAFKSGFTEVAAMKIMLVIPMKHYDILLAKCDTALPEYPMLRNGIITRGQAGQVAVEIPCALEQAEKLLDLARRINPDAAHSIEESIRSCRPI